VPRPSNTARLSFGEITLADLDDMAALLGDPQVMKYDPPPMTRSEVHEWIVGNQESYIDPGFGIWRLGLLPNGEFVGDCGLVLQEVENEIAVEIEFHLHPTQQGNGYATEAALACRDLAATSLRLRHLIAVIAPDNLVCHHVIETIGLRRERTVTHEGRAALLFSGDPLAAHEAAGLRIAAKD
jgi:RimJ/RimL family protein N-acetyltransferase